MSTEKSQSDIEIQPGEKKSLLPTEFELNDALSRFKLSPEDHEKANLLMKQILKATKQIEALQKKQQEILQRKKELAKSHKEMHRVDPKAVTYANMVFRDCSQAVKAMQYSGNFLMRGIKDISASEFVGKSRNDRWAKDSPANAQKLIDGTLKLAGFTALRGNSIFCTSDWYAAASYGVRFFIFPKDGFSFTWNKKHRDLYSDYVDNKSNSDLAMLYSVENDQSLMAVGKGSIDNIFYDFVLDYQLLYNRAIAEKDQDEEDTEDNLAKMPDVQNKLNPKAIAIKNLENMGSEIRAWLKTDSNYVSARNRHNLAKKLVLFLQTYMASATRYPALAVLYYTSRDSINEFVKHLTSTETEVTPERALNTATQEGFMDARNSDFAQALNSSHEIYIHGEYYAFAANFYEDAFSEIFGISL